jgi:hypothetical protein
MKNMYIIRSRISEKKFREILKYFTQDIEATKIAEFTNISEKTINKITKNIRILMSKECEKISKFSGEIFKPPRSFALRLTKATLELRESKRYCACTLFEKRGRGAANKTPVFLFCYAHSCKQMEC